MWFWVYERCTVGKWRQGVLLPSHAPRGGIIGRLQDNNSRRGGDRVLLIRRILFRGQYPMRAWPPQPSRVAPTAIGATDGNLLPHPRHVNSKI
jgi:hypothetical protein